jgi:hypothetical protein
MLQVMMNVIMKSCKIVRNVGATGNNLPVLTYMPIILSENTDTARGHNMHPTQTTVVGRKSIPHVTALNQNDATDTVARIQAVFMPNAQNFSSFMLDIGTTHGIGLSHKGNEKAFSLDELDETSCSKPHRRLIILWKWAETAVLKCSEDCDCSMLRFIVLLFAGVHVCSRTQ